MKTNLVHAYSANSLAPPNIRGQPPPPLPSISDEAVFADFRGRRNQFRASVISDVDLLHPVPPIPKHAGVKGYLKDLSARTLKTKTLYKKVPLLSWIQVYSGRTLLADLIAGIIISLSVIPQFLAYATIAGLPPHVGLYSAFVGPFVYVLFGTSKFVTIGPTAGLAMITLAFIENQPPELYIFLTFVTGVTILLMGVLHLGFLLNFISVPVMSGFTSAMALAICSTQLPFLLGLDYHKDTFLHMLTTTWEKIHAFNWHDLVLGIVCIATILLLQHIQGIARKLHSGTFPYQVDNVLWFVARARNAIVLITCTVLFGYLDDPLNHTPIGDIEKGLDWKVPPFRFRWNGTEGGGVEEFCGWEFLREHWPIVVLFPLIALTEHLTVAKDLDGGGDRLDVSQEMICIGLSNLIGSFFSSMPVTGSFVRPNTSHKYFKDQSPFGGCVIGLLVLLTLFFLTPQFVHIPRATIAAVIVAEVIETIELRILLEMWRSKRWDLIPWALTFLIGLAITLEHGIIFGLSASIVYLLYYTASPQIKVNMGHHGSSDLSFVVVELDRSLIFPAVDYYQHALLKSGRLWAHDTNPVVIDCSHIQFLDFSAAHGIQSLFHKFNAKPQKLILWKMKPSVLRIVKGVMDAKGQDFEHCETEKELEAWLDSIRPALGTPHVSVLTEEDEGIKD